MTKSEWCKRARGYRRTIATLCDRTNDLSAREAAALNTLEELRRDCVRLATELARVQESYDDTVAQVQKHAATIADLRERLVKLTQEQKGNSSTIGVEYVRGEVTFSPQQVVYTPGELSQYPSKTVGEP